MELVKPSVFGWKAGIEIFRIRVFPIENRNERLCGYILLANAYMRRTDALTLSGIPTSTEIQGADKLESIAACHAKVTTHVRQMAIRSTTFWFGYFRGYNTSGIFFLSA